MRWVLLAIVVCLLWFLDSLVHDSCAERCFRVFGVSGEIEHGVLHDVCWCRLSEDKRVVVPEDRHGR
jgi:hypothetical protein